MYSTKKLSVNNAIYENNNTGKSPEKYTLKTRVLTNKVIDLLRCCTARSRVTGLSARDAECLTDKTKNLLEPV